MLRTNLLQKALKLIPPETYQYEKFLGKILFTKEEICSDTNYEGQIYQIQVNQDYYNSEFNLDKKKKNET